MSCCCEKKTIRSNEEKKKLISRINRIKGQINGISNMIYNDRYCDDILIQLSAIDKSIKSLAAVILDSHMHNCLTKSIIDGDTSKIDEIVELFRRFN